MTNTAATATDIINENAAKSEQRDADLALVACDRATALRFGYTLEDIEAAAGRLAQ